jgi:molybdopterin-containing oxidoreductase family membrane subunit
LPSSWDKFVPTWVDIGTMLGAFGLFGVLFLLFCRFLPMIAISEVKGVMPQADPHWEGWHQSHGAGSKAAAAHSANGEHS